MELKRLKRDWIGRKSLALQQCQKRSISINFIESLISFNNRENIKKALSLKHIILLNSNIFRKFSLLYDTF